MKKLRIFWASLIAVSCAVVATQPLLAQAVQQTKGDFQDKFRQLDPEDAPTPNEYRAASGAPGHKYWQQKVDYKINVSLNEATKTLSGTADITYTNNSPDTLTYLWLMLDQNDAKKNSIAEMTQTTDETGRISFNQVRRAQAIRDSEGGFTITKVTNSAGAGLVFDVIDTLLRVDLAEPLKPGQSAAFKVDWTLPMRDSRLIGGRNGYECFTKADQDGNCIFLAAQWFPRAAVYSDYEGWHNKSFLGGGEFTLEFGDYDVAITVPADFAISSTGELVNPSDILSPAQQERMAKARAMGRLAQIHLGRDGCETARCQRRHGHELLPEGRRSLMVGLFDQEHCAHHQCLWPLDLCLSLSRGAIGQWASRRHGISDDYLQWPTP